MHIEECVGSRTKYQGWNALLLCVFDDCSNSLKGTPSSFQMHNFARVSPLRLRLLPSAHLWIVQNALILLVNRAAES